MRFAFKALLVALLLVGSSISVGAQDATPKAADANPHDVTFPSGKDTIGGYLSVTDKPGTHPAILLIHEWWGLNPWVKEQADKYAAQGYVVLAVDLYRGKSAVDPTEAHELSRGVPQDRAMKDLQAAYDYILTRKEVNKDRLAVVGWCMGGGYALQFAIRQPRMSAIVVNYGALPTDPNDLQQIGVPILGSFGADDKGITPADVHAFEDFMKKLGRYVDIKIYPGAGHAFENSNNVNGYRPEAAADAWKRTIAFLHKTMD
jgi:carboxymethylenebutenolidase